MKPRPIEPAGLPDRSGRFADGVIVGSAIVGLIERHVGSSELLPRVGDFIAALRAPRRGI